MSARDDYPQTPGAKFVFERPEYEAMCDEIDRLRSQVAAVNAARSPCPTCEADECDCVSGATDSVIPHGYNCPDCVDGKVSNDQVRLQMCHQLYRAVHGHVVARIETPQQVWNELLDRVASVGNAFARYEDHQRNHDFSTSIALADVLATVRASYGRAPRTVAERVKDLRDERIFDVEAAALRERTRLVEDVRHVEGHPLVYFKHEKKSKKKKTPIKQLHQIIGKMTGRNF